MEGYRNQALEIKQSMPSVSVPAIKLMMYGQELYVQMNLKSLILTSDKKLRLHQGFLFKVETNGLVLSQVENNFDRDRGEVFSDNPWDIKIKRNRKPEIYLASNFSFLFHPHFTEPNFLSELLGGGSKWVDYMDDRETESDIGSYLLRVAKSLIYEEGYINHNAIKVANPRALDYYQNRLCSQPHLFPTDNVQLPVCGLPENLNYEATRKQSFQIHQAESSNVSNRKVKFEVKEEKPAYSPALRIKTDLQTIYSLDSNFRSEPPFSLGCEFYLTMSAFNTIQDHIGWGIRTHDNTVEQGGILLGHAYRNPDTSVVYAIAEQAISGRSARGTAGYLEITHETWKEMLDSVDRMHTDLQLIGWYHTHPNNLDVFMSGTDQTTQQRLFGNDWQFAIVLNPHKKIWRAFYGSASSECRGYVINGSGLDTSD
jgi:proteasome lid subunit RPN8/RPN11